MREKWIVETKKGDFNGLSAKLKVSPLAVRCLMNRGVESEQEMREFLYGTLDDLHDPFLMKGMDEAVREIVKAKEQGRKVAIASDFDCDGIFSAYILWKGFQKIGLDSEIFTPDRVKEGYGLNRRIVDEALAGGRDFLVTCDNGIAANEEVDYAKKLGMTVIVTDHHEVQEQMPNADAILDPKRDDETYPFRGLCGAGVAFKLICALYDAQQVPAEAKDELLEYAGIATVADVMELQGENRILVKYGLKALSHTKNIGLRALLKVQELEDKQITAGHIGFILGPCFNAAGRIATVAESFSLLMEEDEEKGGYEYFAEDTGDASKDDPLNQDKIGSYEILVGSFGTSYNDNRAASIGAIEKAVAKAIPNFSVRRGFTSQIIINHIQARDNEVIDNMEQALEKTGKDITTPAAADLQPVDKWILSKLNTLVKDVTDNMDHFELGIAVQKVYDFIWDEFCDWYIEMVKPRLYSTDDAVSQNAALWTLKTVLIDALKLLHPYMPFITEEIFCTIQNEEESIMISKWPEYSEDRAFPAEEKAIETIKEAVRGIRNIRTEMNVAPSRKASVYVVSENDEIRKIFEEGKLFFASLAYANEIMIQADKTGIAEDAVSVVIPGATLYIPFAELVDIAQEIERLKKEQKRLEGELSRSRGMLSNERFLSKAPEAKIAEEKEKLAKYEQMMEQVTKRLEQLA